MLRHALLATTGLLVAAAPAPDPATRHPAAPAFDAEDVLARTRAAYAALRSYADSGTVLRETAAFTDRSTFRTLISREPRHLLIAFLAVASESGGHRLPLGHKVVYWLEPNAELQTWASQSQSHETFQPDQQVRALQGGDYSTYGISVLIPSHFFSKSGLASAVHAVEEAEGDGFETVHGRKCYRILGVERWRYPSGRVTGVRPITIWVDAETYLIHKILQETPRGMARGVVDRRITTLKHQADPRLEPAQFRFAVPAS